MLEVIARVFGTKHERDIKEIWPLVGEIKAHAADLEGLSDEALAQKTVEFRGRLERGETLDDLLPEAFAVAKETCRRLCGKTWDVCGLPITWDMVPFDVQLLGGIGAGDIVVGEANEAIGVHPHHAGQLVVVAAGDEADPLDAVFVELGHPALGLLLAGALSLLRLGEIEGHPPLGAGAGQLLLAERLPSGELPYFGYGAGYLRISLGDNWESGGPLRTRTGDNLWLFIEGATLEADGAALVRDGRIVR